MAFGVSITVHISAGRKENIRFCVEKNLTLDITSSICFTAKEKLCSLTNNGFFCNLDEHLLDYFHTDMVLNTKNITTMYNDKMLKIFFKIDLEYFARKQKLWIQNSLVHCVMKSKILH